MITIYGRSDFGSVLEASVRMQVDSPSQPYRHAQPRADRASA